ncbi:TetR/AcrR family transcriptional regulator [Pseudonocardia sp. GCM10023141]|uniref:TetR/AcrR family transcriptional regulator n=1 Tax=Pseudonocardia sp. GCM10023141 TaxID=3252653 RepID=UPI0036157CB0
MTAVHGRALRVDAVRNHERITVAASEVFEELGSEASLEEVARRAGVGVATLYRRFGNRDTLVAAVLEHVMTSEIEPALSADTGDPWRDLVDALAASIDVLAAHRVLIRLAREADAIKVDVVDRYLRSMDQLLCRARDAGLVRPELLARDLAAVVVMCVSVIHPQDPSGADRRRYLALLVDGMRPSGTLLPEPATEPEV